MQVITPGEIADAVIGVSKVYDSYADLYEQASLYEQANGKTGDYAIMAKVYRIVSTAFLSLAKEIRELGRREDGS